MNSVEFHSSRAFDWYIKLCSKEKIKFWPFSPPSATRWRFSKILSSNSAFLGSIYPRTDKKTRCFLHLKFSEISHFSGIFPNYAIYFRLYESENDKNFIMMFKIWTQLQFLIFKFALLKLIVYLKMVRVVDFLKISKTLIAIFLRKIYGADWVIKKNESPNNE